MPFPVPTLRGLDENQRSDITSRLPGTDPLLRRSYLGALSRGFSGSIHELYGFQVWIADQAFPDTAEAVELLRWAAIWGVDQVAAQQAEGAILVEGTVGTVVPAATLWRSGNAIDYQTDAEFTIPAAGSGNINVTAVVAAAAGNAPVGIILNLVNPIAGLGSQANVSTAIAGGADIEAIASVRARLLSRIQNPPRGGTSEDYEFWAESGHPDVTRAWARPLAGGLGTVTVYFMTDDATTDGIPNAATVTTVDDYIADRSPVTADVTVAGPVASALNISINNVDAIHASRHGRHRG